MCVSVFLVILSLFTVLCTCDNFDGVHPFLNQELRAFVFLPSTILCFVMKLLFFHLTVLVDCSKFSVGLDCVFNFEWFKAIAILLKYIEAAILVDKLSLSFALLSFFFNVNDYFITSFI